LESSVTDFFIIEQGDIGLMLWYSYLSFELVSAEINNNFLGGHYAPPPAGLDAMKIIIN